FGGPAKKNVRALLHWAQEFSLVRQKKCGRRRGDLKFQIGDFGESDGKGDGWDNDKGKVRSKSQSSLG
ncbi:MAG: hypothetical protein WA871_14030, partial [Candidatus Acidiferrales bacterium]